MPEQYPWTLRLEHEGGASIRVERAGRWLRFDPIAPDTAWQALGDMPYATPIGADEIVVLTAPEHERLVATAHAVRDGLNPTVVAAPEILTWLAQFGALRPLSTPTEVDGVALDRLDFEPIPYAEGAEIAWKAWSALSRPGPSLSRLKNRLRLPRCQPSAFSLGVGGRRFVHLNMALHNHTPEAWMAEAVARVGGADWMLLGVDHGHEEGFMERVARLGARQVLVTDLVSDVRREMGLPTTLLTLLVDRLREQGIDAYVFASRSAFRFE